MRKTNTNNLISKLLKLIASGGSFVFAFDKKAYTFSQTNDKGAKGSQMTSSTPGSDKAKTFNYEADLVTLEKSIAHKIGYCKTATLKGADGKVIESVDLKAKTPKAPKAEKPKNAKAPVITGEPVAAKPAAPKAPAVAKA
jgi:hypothetical protein